MGVFLNVKDLLYNQIFTWVQRQAQTSLSRPCAGSTWLLAQCWRSECLGLQCWRMAPLNKDGGNLCISLLGMPLVVRQDKSQLLVSLSLNMIIPTQTFVQQQGKGPSLEVKSRSSWHQNRIAVFFSTEELCLHMAEEGRECLPLLFYSHLCLST